MKKYSNAPFKLIVAAFLMCACVYSVVLLYKDSQHRSLQCFNGGVGHVAIGGNNSDANTANYPVVSPTDNKIGTSNAYYPTFKGTNGGGNDYSAAALDINPTVITSSVGASVQGSSSSNGQSSYSSNNNSSNNSSSGIAPLSMYSATNAANSATVGSTSGSQSLFANNSSMTANAEMNGGRTGRMLVDENDPPGEPGIPVGNGTWIMLIFASLYGIYKFRQNKEVESNN